MAPWLCDLCDEQHVRERVSVRRATYRRVGTVGRSQLDLECALCQSHPWRFILSLSRAWYACLRNSNLLLIHCISGTGTIFIAGGAVLIAIFGTVDEPTHTLEEFIALYTRPAFLVFFSLLIVSISAILIIAHLAEFKLNQTLKETLSRTSQADPYHRKDSVSHANANLNRRRKRRWSEPQGNHRLSNSISSLTALEPPTPAAVDPQQALAAKEAERQKAIALAVALERTRLFVGIAYGGASGTLSGLCLLFAKTGVELLILTGELASRLLEMS